MPDEASLEDRLRDLLCDPRWSLRPWPDALGRVQRAARRQRIKAISAAACTGAVAAAACAVPLAVLGAAPGPPVPSTHTPTPSAAQPSAATRQMPLVVGMQEAAAVNILQAALSNPQINIVRVRTSTPPGTVVAQTPVAGTRVAPGSVITVEVS